MTWRSLDRAVRWIATIIVGALLSAIFAQYLSDPSVFDMQVAFD